MADPVGSFAPMLARVIPAVVTIRVTSETLESIELKPDGKPAANSPAHKILSRSGGSGVIVDAGNGHILTNNHVIDGAVKIEVVLSDGRLMPAKLVGRDIGTDLAVIEVSDRELAQVAVGNSDKVRVGDVVAAIGNPFGLEGTATLGIVSATMRTEIGHEAFEDFLQIDAVINPGNSGGALVNVRGELVGINTATAGTSGNVGIGFAIPINMARTIKAELIRNGRMQRGSPGLIVEDLSYERAAELMSGTNRGALVTGVVPGSPAAAAGILPGAIVTEIAGKPVRGAVEFNTRVVTVPLGTSLPLVLRENAKDKRYVLQTAAVKLPSQEFTMPDDLGGISGLVVTDISLGNPLYGELRGAQVVKASPDRPAGKIGLRPGDVVVGVDDANVRNSAHLYRYANRASMSYRLRIVRNGEPGWLRVNR
ncbi:MAG: trypsin-like peptidase domain-containing protein [Hyphomicrobium sp.]